MQTRILSALAPFLCSAMTLGLAWRAAAVNPVTPTISGNNLVLTWASQSNQAFLIYYRVSFEPGTAWTALSTNWPAAANTNVTVFVHTNALTEGFGSGPQCGQIDEPECADAVVATTESASLVKTRSEKGMLDIRTYELPPLPWSAKAQAAIVAEYPGLLPQLPWNEKVQKEIVATHEQEQQRATSSVMSLSSAESSSGAPGGFYVVTEYFEDEDGDGLPNYYELMLGLQPLKRDSNGNGVNDELEDPDGDGVPNFLEYVMGTLPQEADGQYPPPPLTTGGVFSGEDTFILQPTVEITNSYSGGGGASSNPEDTQEFLYLDTHAEMTSILVVTQPTNGVQQVKWYSIFYPASGYIPGTNHNNAGDYVPTEEEKRLLAAANGNTDIGTGRIGEINQQKYDELPKPLLEWQQAKAEEGLRKTQKLLQEVESGVRPASAAFKRSLRANVTTQAKRLAAATKALARGFGSTIGKYLPFIGGIMIAANASDYTESFTDAAIDYANDIANGDDTTGSSAILALWCEQLAPFSQYVVLNYLWR